MLDHCRQSHPWCSRRNAPLLLPSRLLSIGNRLEDTIYLTNKISESMQYAALSHCWGRSRHALLTTVNEAQYRTQLMYVLNQLLSLRCSANDSYGNVGGTNCHSPFAIL